MNSILHTIILGNYGQGNYGDDLLLRGILNGLRNKVPDEEICVITKRLDYLKSWYPRVNFVSSQEQLQTKYLIYGGGTQFFSFPNKHSPWLSRLLNLPFYLRKPKRILQRARQLFHPEWGIQFEKAAAISIGIGPFIKDSPEEVRAVEALRGCQFVSVRDSMSLAWLERWHIEGGMIYPDLVFATELWSDKPLSGRNGAPSQGEIGIIVRDWPHSREGMSYFRHLYKAVSVMRNEGMTVRFILFAKDYDKESRNFLEEREESLLVWDPLKTSPADFAVELSSFALLVTARAHGLVVGCALGIPTIAVEIEPKLRLIGERIREGGASWSTPFNPQSLLSSVQKIMGNYSQFSVATRRESELCSRESRESLLKLLSWMDGSRQKSTSRRVNIS